MGSILIGLSFAMPILFLAHEYVIKPIANLIKDWNSPSNASTDETVTHPTISGASNASANGRVVPLVLGKSYFAPYYMGRQNNGYTYLSYSEASGTDGSKEVYTNLYILGYKDIQVRNIKMGTIPLATNDGNTWGVLPSEGYDITKKVQQDIESGELALDINSYYKPDDLKNYEMKLELKQNQQGSANEISFFNQKVIQTSYGNEMLNADGDKNPNYAFSAKYPQKIEIEIQFPQGLIDYDDEGKQAYAEVKVGLQMSLDGGTTWIPAVYFDDTHASTTFTKTEVTDDRGTVSVTGFKYKKRETMRFVATVEFSNFTVADSITNKIVEFRLYRENANSTSTNCIDSVYLSKIRTWCYDTKLSREAYESGSDILIPQAPIGEKIRDKTARLGFQVLAGDEFQNSIDKINAIVTSKCYIYDEENEEWDFEHKVATDNPASLALWAMIGEHRGLYAYDIEKIDLDSFGEFYKWCAEERDFAGVVMPRFACDTVLTKQTKTSDLVNQILSCGRGSLIINGSQYGVLIDKPRTQTVHILNNQNILKRDNIKNFDEVPDGYECKFMNAMLDNEEDSIIAVPDGVEVTDDLKLQRIELPCINNPYRARAMGLYMLACAKYRPESWNVKLSTDGNLIELGNLVEIQDDTILVGIGNGGEVLQLIFDDDDTPTEIVGMITDGLFPIDDDTKEYAIKILKYYDVNGESLPVKIVKKVSREQVTANKAIFTFDDPISLNETYQPEVGDVISFGEYGKETSQSLCFSKKENGDGTFDLVLVPYDERVYTADSESADWGEFDSNVTPKQNVESTELSQAKYKGIENLQENVWNTVSEISADVSDISDRVDAVEERIDDLNLDTTPPTVPSITSVTSTETGNFNIVFSGSTDTESGVSHYNIYRMEANSGYELIARVDHNSQVQSYTASDVIINKGKTYSYKISAVDNANNESVPCTPVSQSSVVTALPIAPTNLLGKVVDESKIEITWTKNATTDAVYASKFFNLYLSRDDGATWTKINTPYTEKYYYYFDRNIDGYPETTDLADYKVKVEAVSEYGKVSTAIESYVTYTGYKGWTISAPTVNAVAFEKYIQLNWFLNNDSYGVKKYSVYLGNTLLKSGLSDTSYVYDLTSLLDTADVSALDFKVKVESEATNVMSASSYPDTSNYLGYALVVPTVLNTVNGRCITLKWDEQNCYGWSGVDIQVAKAYKLVDGVYTPIVDSSELVWYAPALGLNPYASLDNYKTGDAGGYLQVKGNTVSFSVPLYGQATSESINTLYAYRIQAKNTKRNSDYSAISYIEARATSAYDIVKAWNLNNSGEKVKIDGALGVKQIFVEELSALCANLGYITDGALQGDQYNYWAVNDTPMSDGSTLYKGSFRVGGTQQYIKVTPKLSEGVPTGEYDIDFVVNDVTISSAGTRIDGNSFSVYDNNGNLMFKTAPEGNLIQVKTGTYKSSAFTSNVIGENNESSQSFSDYVHSFIDSQLNDYVILPSGELYKNGKSTGFIIPNYSDSDLNRYFTYNNKLLVPNTSANDLFTLINLEDYTYTTVTYTIPTGYSALLYSPRFILLRKTSGDTLSFLNLTNLSVTDTDIPSTVYTLYREDEDYIYTVTYTSLNTLISRIAKDGSKFECAITNVQIDTTDLNNIQNFFVSVTNEYIFLGVSSLNYYTSESSYETFENALVRVKLSDITWGNLLNNDIGYTDIDIFSSDIESFLGGGNTSELIIKSTTFITAYGVIAGSFYKATMFDEVVKHSYNVNNTVINIKGDVSWNCLNNGDSDIEYAPFTYLGFYEKINGQIVFYRITTPIYGLPTTYFERCSFFYEPEQTNTGLRTYGAGIGFIGIYFDEGSSHYRYVLDSGAYIEFDENGQLIAKGQTGAQGAQGQDGASLINVEQTTVSTEDSGDNVITFTLATGATRTVTIKNGSKGSTGQDGSSITISSYTVNYAVSTSGTTAPSSGWSSTIPSDIKGKYLWSRVVTNFSDSTSITSYCVAYNANDITVDSSLSSTSTNPVQNKVINTALSGKQATLTAKGSTTKPIYVSASGTTAECSTYAGGTKVTLNGTSKGASTADFYAPTGAGTSGQFLKSNGSGAPSWQTVTIMSESEIKTLINSLFTVSGDTLSITTLS